MAGNGREWAFRQPGRYRAYALYADLRYLPPLDETERAIAVIGNFVRARIG